MVSFWPEDPTPTGGLPPPRGHASLRTPDWGVLRRRSDLRHVTMLPSHIRKENYMSTITTTDGTEIYYKDWGDGPVVTFSHGWPLSADAWDGQMLFLAQNGFRAVAHDRRGHGRSSQASAGNDMN